MTARPRILINASYLPRPEGGHSIVLKSSYAEAIALAGGLPLIIPPTDHAETVREEVARAGGVLLIGGDDMSSSRYGQPASPLESLLHPTRENFDFALLAETLRQNKPLLAVCLGFQIFNVHYGGTLYRDLLAERPGTDRHQKKTRPSYATHNIRVTAGSALETILSTRDTEVNSSHHQGIRDLGKGLVASAVAQDGTIEGIEDPTRKFAIGVQWHPEDMQSDPRQAALFKAFIAAAM